MKTENDIKILISELIEEEKSIGRDYPISVAYKNHLEELLKAKDKKIIMALTSELDYFLKTGDKFAYIYQNTKANIIREFLFDLLIKKRRDAVQKYNTTELHKWLNEKEKEIIEAHKYISNEFKTNPQTDTERRYRNIIQSFQDVIDTIDEPEKIGLYEETQFATLKKEVAWNLRSIKRIVKQNDYWGFLWERYYEEFEKLIHKTLETKMNKGGLIEKKYWESDGFVKCEHCGIY